MTRVVNEVTPFQASPPRLSALLRCLASLKLGVVLLILLGAVLAGATFLEAAWGREYVQWYVYGSPWFVAILALLGTNVLAATLVRFPWKRAQTGFVIVHAGLLVLLIGSIQTLVSGIEGRLAFIEGETADTILMSDRCVLTTIWHRQRGPVSAEFAFSPGPADWPAGKSLEFSQSDDVGVKVVGFYRHAREEVHWIADESQLGGPAIKFALTGPDGKLIKHDWLAGNPFGAQVLVGPSKFELISTSAPSLLDDFLDPRSDDKSEDGTLSMHYGGRMYRVGVHDNVGKKVPLGKTGILVEIVEYLPNATPSRSGQFVSRGDKPKNPLLELRVHIPDKQKPIRQIAFASVPFLNLDGVHGWECPVKFWYHHSAVSAPPGTEFLQTPDGKLYCRVGIEGKYQPRGEVKAGEEIATSAGFKVSVLEYLPHARRKVTSYPVKLARGETGGSEAAALVEVTAGGTTEQVWLKRSDQQHGVQRIQTDDGPLLVAFAYERVPLGFSLKLLDFKRGWNPGQVGNASFASAVQLVDSGQEIDEERTISMNQPLKHGKFTFYQSSFQELPGGQEASVLNVACDPGRFLKYLGSLMICGGIFTMFYRKTRARWRIPFPIRKPTPNKKCLMRKSAAILFASLALTTTAFAGNEAANTFDWDQWYHFICR